MYRLPVVGCLFLVVSIMTAEMPPVKIRSEHTQDALHLTLSLAKNQVINLYSLRLVESGDHHLEINTFGDQASFNPPLNPEKLLVNTEH